MVDALSRASAAVVGVRVTAADEARSTATLGKERAGSGVVIGSDGLILTIGYLMLEAQDIRIVTQDNKTLPAVAVGYDLATGFGLIRPLLPMAGVAPVELGSQASSRTDPKCGICTTYASSAGPPPSPTTWAMPTAVRSSSRLRRTSSTCTRNSSSNTKRRRAAAASAMDSGI